MTDIVMTAEPYNNVPDEHYIYLKEINFCCETMMTKFFDGEIKIFNKDKYPIVRPKNLPRFKSCPFCHTEIRIVAKRPGGHKVPLKSEYKKSGPYFQIIVTDPEIVWEIENSPNFNINAYLEEFDFE